VELLADATPEAQGQGDPQPVTSPVAGRSAQHIQVATPEGAATVAVASAEGAVLVAVASAEGQVAVARWEGRQPKTVFAIKARCR